VFAEHAMPHAVAEVLAAAEHLTTLEEEIAVAGILSHASPDEGEALLIEMLKPKSLLTRVSAIGGNEVEPARVQIAACDALAAIGTTRAVEPLLKLVKHGTHRVRKHASEAISIIQDRLGDIEPGRLSLSDTPGSAGALSMNPTRGGVSLNQADDPSPDSDP